MAAVTVCSIIPNHEQLLALEPEELAAVIIEVLNASEADDPMIRQRTNFTMPGGRQTSAYPSHAQQQVCEALTEAWIWLEREGLIARSPGAGADRVFITRRGKQLTGQEQFKAYRAADVLPRRLLHPLISSKVGSMFMRGDLEGAVHQAFKEVEVSVRRVCGFPFEDVGVPLMRKAFEPGTGPLTDRHASLAEQEAMASLFAGAICLYLYKNPPAHREGMLTQEEAIERILLASHLLRIVGLHVPHP